MNTANNSSIAEQHSQMDLLDEPVNVMDAEPDLSSYDKIIVGQSGGKDSLACILHLLDKGVPKEKIELWHHLVDGREGSSLMDWPVTDDYCRKFADAFGMKLFFSWKTGGFEREMLRKDSPTASTKFETPEGVMESGGTRGKPGTRLKFPQVGASLTTRWCSAYLKISVADTAIRNDLRFANSRTLVVTGERAEESPARAKYKTFEPDRSDLRNGKAKRLVDRWRPVHKWTEEQVWEIIERYKVNPHPAYRLGFGRTSCLSCIFGSKDQWATVKSLSNEHFERIANYEEDFGVTIHRTKTVRELAAMGTAYQIEDDRLRAMALSPEHTDPIIVDDWELPPGAFGESTGPT